MTLARPSQPLSRLETDYKLEMLGTWCTAWTIIEGKTRFKSPRIVLWHLKPKFISHRYSELIICSLDMWGRNKLSFRKSWVYRVYIQVSNQKNKISMKKRQNLSYFGDNFCYPSKEEFWKSLLNMKLRDVPHFVCSKMV